jgi:hypothetical protein
MVSEYVLLAVTRWTAAIMLNSQHRSNYANLTAARVHVSIIMFQSFPFPKQNHD